MKIFLLTLLGGLFVILGAIFIVVPGPSLPLLLIGFTLLSFKYPLARKYLRIVQKQMSKSARWIDRKILYRKIKDY